MLRIFWSLAAFAGLVWVPIIIYVFFERNYTTRRATIEKIAVDIPYRKFGKGSRYGFEKYLERDSVVEVNSMRDICDWLMGCEYTRDQELFNQPDLWQHPMDFETNRQGDCEDHALWAWRKLHDLGIEAEFVVGKIRQKNGSWGDHSWVVIANGSDTHILETTAKKMDRFFVSGSRPEREYLPVYGINTKLFSYIYKRQKTK